MTPSLPSLFLFPPLLAALFLSAACSGGGGGSGGGSSGGGGLGPVGPIPQGAWSLTFTNQSPIDCVLASHNAALGMIDASVRGQVVVDGVDGVSVACSVIASAPPSFSVHGKLTGEGGDELLEITLPSIGPGATKDAPATGQVVYASPQTAGEPNVGDACSFYFVPETPETVDTGKMWAAFECPAIVSGGSTCTITEGYVILENCATE